MPITKTPKTHMFQFRCDLRMLATIARVLTANGFKPTSYSNLGDLIVTFLHDYFVEKGLAEPTLRTEVAIAELNKILVEPNRDSRIQSNIMVQLMKEDEDGTA